MVRSTGLEPASSILEIAALPLSYEHDGTYSRVFNRKLSTWPKETRIDEGSEKA